MFERQIYYNKEGKAITLDEWGYLFENMDYRKVAESCIGKYNISTVWMGLNHNIFNDEPMHIFETLIMYEDREDELSGYTERYSTLEEAFEGHKQAMNLAKEATK